MDSKFVEVMGLLCEDIEKYLGGDDKSQPDNESVLQEVAEIINREITKEKNRLLLYPDMTREQYKGSETFVFAAPCTQAEWKQLKSLSSTIDDGDHLPFTMIDEDTTQVCIVLMFQESIDAHAVETAAWARLTHEFTGMIYALKYNPAPPDDSLAATIGRTAGANPKLVRHIDLPPPKNLGA